MMRPDDDRREEEFAALLGAYDEALAQGRTPSPVQTTTDEALRRRLAEAADCLDLLEAVWPRDGGAAAEQAALAPFASALPTQLGRFQLKRELGRGGHGVVWLAFDPVLRRDVALKVPRPETLASAEMRRRFRREAEVAARLDHPNLVAIHEVGETAVSCYLVTAYCPGPTLAAWLREHPAPPPVDAARLVLQLALAVEYMHRAGIVHRDLKPANILLTTETQRHREDKGRAEETKNSSLCLCASVVSLVPKITDFGLAKLAESASQHTRTGTVLGTLAYMAPEQADGRVGTIGAHSDIYALGVVLYECLTGAPPFRGATEADTLRQVLGEEPAPPRQARQAVPRDIETICLTCLQKEPGRRYGSAAALANDLRAFLEGRPIAARPAGRWERALKWTRRHPAVATLGGMTLAALACLIVGMIWYGLQMHEHNVALQTALGRAEDGERRLQEENYAIQIKLADSLRDEDPSGLLGDQLRKLRPGPEQIDLRSFEWRHLWAIAQRHLRLRGHRFGVSAVAISPDGKTCVSGDGEGIIRFWAVASGSPLGEIRGHTASVNRMAFGRDGRFLVTGAGGGSWEKGDFGKGEMIVWEVATRAERARLGADGKFYILDLDAERDLRYIAFFRDLREPGWTPRKVEWQVGLWDWLRGEVKILYECPAYCWVPRPAIAPDGRLLALPSLTDGEVLFWEVPSGRPLPPLPAQKEALRALAFSPDGSALVSGGMGGTIVVTDLRHGTGKDWTVRQDKPVEKLAFGGGSHGQVLALLADLKPSEPDKGVIRLWNWPGGERRPEELRLSYSGRDIVWSPDGQTLALASGDHHVHLWRPFAESATATLEVRGTKEAWSVAFSPDNQTLAVGYDDEAGRNRETLKLWDVGTRRELANLRGHTSMVSSVAFAPDGRTLYSAGFDKVVKLWDLQSQKELATLGGHTNRLWAVACSPDGQHLASAGEDQRVKVWDTVSRQQCFSLGGYKNLIHTVAFAPGGKTFASGDDDGDLRIWDAITGRPIRAIKDSTQIMALAYSPDGRSLASANRDGIVLLHDGETDSERRSLVGHRGEARAVAYSLDGKTLATGGADRTVRLWQVATGRELLVFKGLPAKVNSVAFSPDGRHLAAALHDGSVRLWHAAPAEGEDGARYAKAPGK
jgi:WD40 repeat protein